MLKNLVIWLVIGLVLMTVFNQFQQRQQVPNTIDYSSSWKRSRQGVSPR